MAFTSTSLHSIVLRHWDSLTYFIDGNAMYFPLRVKSNNKSRKIMKHSKYENDDLSYVLRQ